MFLAFRSSSVNLEVNVNFPNSSLKCFTILLPIPGAGDERIADSKTGS